MFLESTISENKALIETAFELQQKGLVLPDTFVIDVDTFLENARKIKAQADLNGVRLYFMSKQFGRNPYLCKKLLELGYVGAVVVDYKEALRMIENDIHIGHIGHLVQIPKALLRKILLAEPDYITVYSFEKALEINTVCKELGRIQKLMLRVIGEQDFLYPGQYGGFPLEGLDEVVEHIKTLEYVKIDGLTSFPCILYNSQKHQFESTPNMETIKKAKMILEHMGIQVSQINLPSATCTASLPLIKQNGGNFGEPGHGLTGTTPYHSKEHGEEKPAIVYVTEVSHNIGDKAYCYGGGHYRRSHVHHALVGKNYEASKCMQVTPPTDENIDYYFELEEMADVSDGVIMGFRFQIFVTRSDVAIVEGIGSGKPKIIGIYNALGIENKDIRE